MQCILPDFFSIPVMEISIKHLESVDSTNRYAKDCFAELADAALVLADVQTAGKGRLGRTWISPSGENIYASFVMKRVKTPFLATAAASLSVLRTLRELAPGKNFYLKWPNDVYCGMDKICGILSEGVLAPGGGGFAGIVAGMGININGTAESLADAGQATSLFLLTGEHFSLKKVLSALEKQLIVCYINYLTSPDFLFEEWKAENRLIGRILEFETASGKTIRATFHGIASSGDAILMTETGEQQIFSCGDVRILKNTWNENQNNF